MEVADTSLAGGDHELPLNFSGLDLAGTLKIEAGLLVEALLNIIDSQPHIGIQIHGEEAVRL